MAMQGGGSSDFTPLMDRIAVDAALAGSDAGFDGRKLQVWHGLVGLSMSLLLAG